MSKILKEIIKFSSEEYKTESNVGGFKDYLHIFLLISVWLLNAFAAFLGLLIILAIPRIKQDWDALLLMIFLIVVSLTFSYWLKKVRVKIYYRENKKS